MVAKWPKAGLCRPRLAGRRYGSALSNFCRVIALVACAGSLQGGTFAHPSSIILVPHATPTASTSQAKPAPEDKFLTVGGLRLHYLDWGGAGKPPLLMFHGIARHAHTFDHIAADLSRDYHVIAVDLRGHGDSAWSPEGAYLVEDYVKDLEAMVAQLRLKNLTLLGNSTGGRVAQVFAGMHPELVSAVVVEDVGPERPQDIASGFARRVQEEANGWASEDELVA